MENKEIVDELPIIEDKETPVDELLVNKLLDYNIDLRDLHQDIELLREFLCEYFEVGRKDVIVNRDVTVVVDKIDTEMIYKLSNIREKTKSVIIEIKPFTRTPPDRVSIDFTFKQFQM